MNVIIARPLVRGLRKISAYRPPITVSGTDAQVPHITRKASKEGQLGARAQASVPRMKTLKVQNVTTFLPKLSLMGLKTNGPKVYPMRYTVVGK